MVKKNNIINLNPFLQIIKKNKNLNKIRNTKHNLPKIFGKKKYRSEATLQ